MKMEPEQNITPDRWVIIEITHDDKTFRKILSSWNGGYLDGDGWRLSSTITNETEMKHYNEYQTDSGSTYKCLHSREGLTSTTRIWLSHFRERIKDKDNVTVRLLCYGDPT